VDLEVFYLGHVKNLYTIQYNTILKTPIAIISGTDEATNSKFCSNTHTVHPNKSPLKFW